MLVDGSKITTTAPFLLETNSDANGVTVDFTYPDGVSYDSSTASGGTFDGSTWTVATLQAVNPLTLYITVTVDDVAAFLAGDRTIIGVATYPGEVITSNNTSIRVLGTEPDDAEPPEPSADCCIDYSFSEQGTNINDAQIGFEILQRSYSIPASVGSIIDTGIPFTIGQLIKYEHLTRNSGADVWEMNAFPLSTANTFENNTFELDMPAGTAPSILTIWYIDIG